VNREVDRKGAADTALGYKLEERLRAHFAVCAAARLTRAALAASSDMRMAHTALIKSASYIAKTLPAIPAQPTTAHLIDAAEEGEGSLGVRGMAEIDPGAMDEGVTTPLQRSWREANVSCESSHY
jgi:hypothetical protein